MREKESHNIVVSLRGEGIESAAPGLDDAVQKIGEEEGILYVPGWSYRHRMTLREDTDGSLASALWFLLTVTIIVSFGMLAVRLIALVMGAN